MIKDLEEAIPDIVAAAIRLGPAVRAASDDAERTRQTPAPLADELARAGMYQMYLPRSMGGPETPPLTAFRVVEELSRADGSVGWCAMIATAMSLNASRLPADVGRALAGSPADYRAAGSARPGGPSGGRAWEVPGGYRVNGRWNFASGIYNARWLYCTCVMMDGDTPRTTAAGAPLLRAVWVPRESVTIVDTWSVMGMCGTGSQDFTVDDIVVPAERSCLSDSPPQAKGPLYDRRAWYVTLWTPSAANALGIARGAIDSLTAIAATEASTLSTSLLRDRTMVQARVGEADAIVNAARAYVFDAVGRVWHGLCAGQTPSDQEIAQARLAIVHAMHESARAVDKVFHAAGTNAIYNRLPLERAFRDIHVAVQHGAALPGLLRGRRPGAPRATPGRPWLVAVPWGDRTKKGRPGALPLDPAEGKPSEPATALGGHGGPTETLHGPGWPSMPSQTNGWIPKALPLAGVEGAKPLALHASADRARGIAVRR